MDNKEAHVEYLIIQGNTDTDEDIEALVNILKHSLRTQFGCKPVTITIESQEPDDNDTFDSSAILDLERRIL